MMTDSEDRPRILLIAPNISRFMGGEAIKSLHILEGYRNRGFDVVQVCHARVRREITEYAPDLPVQYIEDGPVQVWLFKLRLNWLLGFVGSWLLTRKAQKIAAGLKPWLVHVTSPISPSYPFLRVKGAPMVIGPLNGNLLHPPAFAHRDSRAKVLGARILPLVQVVNRLLFHGVQKATLFISGGERTVKALELAGCRCDQMVFTLDSGVSDDLRAAPRLAHQGENWRFVFVGRLVQYKACDLAIRALAQVPNAKLDVMGDGPERPGLEALAQELGIADRVNFLGYQTPGPAMFERWKAYRAFIFPTLAEANGIVIQEAMMIGLPVVALDWGGPVELLDSQTGILIPPTDELKVIAGLTDAMKKLGQDAELAERLSIAAREKAERLGYDWQTLLENWLDHYNDVLEKAGSPHSFPRSSKSADRIS